MSKHSCPPDDDRDRVRKRARGPCDARATATAATPAPPCDARATDTATAATAATAAPPADDQGWTREDVSTQDFSPHVQTGEFDTRDPCLTGGGHGETYVGQLYYEPYEPGEEGMVICRVVPHGRGTMKHYWDDLGTSKVYIIEHGVFAHGKFIQGPRDTR